MNKNNSMQKDEKDVVKEADKLLSSIKNSNADFTDKTEKIVTDLNEDIDSVEKDFDKTEKELEKIEKDTINEIDEAIIKSMS